MNWLRRLLSPIDGEEILWHLKRVDPRKWVRKVFRFIHRGRYGWNVEDTWSMDYSLAKLLAGLIAEFRHSTSFTHPHGMTSREWDEILREIQFGFQSYAAYKDFDWDGLDLDMYDYATVRKRLDRAFALMNKHYEDLWW